MPGKESRASFRSRSSISLDDKAEAELDEIFKVLRENITLAGQTQGVVIAVSTLLIGLSAVPVALALGSLALPLPSKSILASWGLPTLVLSSGATLFVVAAYGLGMLVYLPFFTVMPTARLARFQVEATTESVHYALSDRAGKQAILESIISYAPRRYFERRASVFAPVSPVASYVLGLSYFLFFVAAVLSMLVILVRIPAN